MKTEIFHLIEGAERAEGLTVVIDVFRAFSMECYLYAAGAEEDELCAVCLRDMLAGAEPPGLRERLKKLRTGGGSHFFVPGLQDVYPEKDFWMCIDLNRFDFVLQAERDGDGLVSRVRRAEG